MAATPPLRFPSFKLIKRSLEIILENQSPSGAFIASPDFPNYHYCWFRDGSFIAYAMDLIGEHASAARFHEWAARVINRRAGVVQRAISRTQADEPLSDSDYLHTRYTTDGEEAASSEWPDFQTDGFGTWLWSLGEHLVSTGRSLPATWEQATELVANYLTAVWRYPCYDCWEENPDRIHLYTLAAIHSGLKAHARFMGRDHQEILKAIAALALQESRGKSYFAKFIGSDMVDASLLGLATPYRLVEPDDPLILKTVSHIEHSLIQGGGVHRYPTDSYYGGGEWVLLAGWLGWYFAEVGKYEQAKVMLEWMERQADVNGFLPEQVPANLNSPNSYEPWVNRWGPIAKPLLWSHAKYIILSYYLSL